MVKYGAYLQAVDCDAPPEWRGKFIRYKALKQALKACSAASADCEPQAAVVPPASAHAEAGAPAGEEAWEAGGPALPGAAGRFFELLKAELLRVNRCFVTTARTVVRSFQRTEMRRRCADFWPMRRLLRVGPARYAALAEQTYWCRKYARANAVALRKILKKYDKQNGGQRGRSFLQHCWRMPTGGAFLHSPLLDELKAIQDVLQEQRMQQEDVQLCEPANTAAKDGSEPAAAPAADGVPAADGGNAKAKATQPAGAEPPKHLQLDSGDFEWDPEGSAAGGSQKPQHALPGRSLDLSPQLSAALSVSTTTLAPSATPLAADGLALPASAAAACAAAAAAVVGGETAVPGGDAVAPNSPLAPIPSRFTEDELNCPICLDLLFKPVGLACGHKFCKHCALEHAALGKAVGTFANLCSYVSPSLACPQCRQAGVYRGAVRLRQLERVLKTRRVGHAAEWAERVVEERQRERVFIKHVVAQQRAAARVRWWVDNGGAHGGMLGL